MRNWILTLCVTVAICSATYGAFWSLCHAEDQRQAVIRQQYQRDLQHAAREDVGR